MMNTISATPVTTMPENRLLRGKPLKDALLAQVPPALAVLGRAPRLAVVQVGDNPASSVYVAQKQKVAESLGMACDVHRQPADTTQHALEALLAKLAEDRAVDAVILQLPLPAHIEKQRAMDMIPLAKDIDGLTSAGMTARRTRARCHLPATPLGVLRLLEGAGVPLKGTKALMVGRSALVGEPLADLLRQRGADVLGMLGRDAADPAALARQADLLCVAVGVPGLITPAWVKDGAVVIDVGLTRTSVDGTTCLLGDVAPEVVHTARLLTPVPGGVGPMTVASLLTNTVDAAFWADGKPLPAWRVAQL